MALIRYAFAMARGLMFGGSVEGFKGRLHVARYLLPRVHVSGLGVIS
jgi:hypothetical protein